MWGDRRTRRPTCLVVISPDRLIMQEVLVSATREVEVFHPRVSRTDSQPGSPLYAKRAWPGGEGESILRREFSLQTRASQARGPHGVLATAARLSVTEPLELVSPAIVQQGRVDRSVIGDEPDEATLLSTFQIGQQLGFLHSSTPPDEWASPEEPILMPIPIEHFSRVPDSTVLLLKELPAAVSTALRGRKASDIGRSVFIHGDFKPDNIFASDGRVLFIDWERGGRGDPMHDLAAFIAGVLSLRLSSVGLAGIGDFERSRSALTSASLGSWRLAAAFLNGYGVSMESANYYEQLIRMVGAKLLARTQTVAYFGSPGSPHVHTAMAMLSRLTTAPKPAAKALRNVVRAHGRATA